jgi:RHS repeat-associated protein
MPEQARQMMEQDIKQALQGGLTPQAQAMLGAMAGQTNETFARMREGLQEIRQQEQTPVEIHFYHCDHLGTPIALTDRQGQVIWAARYDPWGGIQEEFNPKNINQDIRLPGQHHDLETGLYYNRYRYYDPKSGDYINQDPIGLAGGINPFTYVNSRVTSSIDPIGLDDTSPWKTGWEWLTGTGPRSHSFTDGDDFTEILRQHKHIQDLMKKACNPNFPRQGRDPYTLRGVDGVSEFITDYSSVLTGGATGNLAAAYLGSYGLNYSINGNIMTINVFNTSSIESATHPPIIGYTSWWHKYVGDSLNKLFSTGAMSATTQTFTIHQDLTCICN